MNHEEEHLFDGQKYLEEYFLQLNEEYAGLYSYWCDVISKAPNGPALDIGVGPTLYSTIPLAAKSRIIDVADLVPDAMSEIKGWLDNKSSQFNWKRHIRMILLLEGLDATDEQVKLREHALRQQIRHLLSCDMHKPYPLNDPNASYAIVSAHYCTAAACSDNEQWYKLIKNLTGLINPGGLFLLSVTVGLSRFRDYGEQQRCQAAPIIEEEDIKYAFHNADLNISTLDITVLTSSSIFKSPLSWNLACFLP